MDAHVVLHETAEAITEDVVVTIQVSYVITVIDNRLRIVMIRAHNDKDKVIVLETSQTRTYLKAVGFLL